MTIESTRETVLGYLKSEHGDVSKLANDVTFTLMATGQDTRGPEAVLGMLQYLYHVAFNVNFIPRVMLFGESNAMVEGDFTGKHIGEFNGIPATGKDVRVPLCIVYDVLDKKITRARIYFELPALLSQLGVKMG